MTSLRCTNDSSFHSKTQSPASAGRVAARIQFPFNRLWMLAVLLLAAPLSSGCGDSNGVAPVHGTVTLDGKPLSEGFVMVTPADGRTAKGAIQPDGTFVLGTFSSSDGVAIGTHPVTVLPPTAKESQPLSATARSLPNKYSIAATSGITVDVKPDTDNELTIELSSK